MCNKLLKYISFVFCMAFGLLFLTSCAEVGYSMEILENGGRTLELNVAVLKTEAGNNLNIIKNEVTRAMTNYKQAFEMAVSAETAVYSIVITPKEDEDLWEQTLKMTFNSALDYIKAFAILKGEDVTLAEAEYESSKDAEPDITETFLYKKQNLGKLKNAFAGNSELIEQFETSFRQLGVPSAAVDFTQVVIYPSEKVRSNADMIIKQDGKSYHLFRFTRENMDEKEIEFYAIFPKPENWYLLALSITIIFAGAYFVINRLKIKSKK